MEPMLAVTCLDPVDGGGSMTGRCVQRNMMFAWRAGLVLLVLLGPLVGCTVAHPPLVEPDPSWKPIQSATVLVLPPDSRVARITLGGVQEERVDWSREARKELQDALASRLDRQGLRTVPYPPHGDVVPWRPEDASLLALHEVVFFSILAAERLPTQRARRPHLDYSLGDSVRRLRDRYGADYALLVQCRASYASEGREAVGVVAALTGRFIDTGTVTVFASLVDLSDGRVIWVNAPGPRLTLWEGIDVRQPDGAVAVANVLLDGVPL